MRTAEITRKTGETDITLGLTLEGTGKSSVSTALSAEASAAPAIPISGIKTKHSTILTTAENR